MTDVYVLDADLQLIGIVDAYKSLIWASRYQEIGDCELYVPASIDNLDLLQIGRFLTMADSDMICQINRIQLDTDAEDGNYLTASGVDVKQWLDRRIVWTTMQTHGKAENFIRQMVNDALGAGADEARQMQDSTGRLMFGLGTAQGFDAPLTTQVSYKNVGEKVRELCVTYGWGYRVRLDDDVLRFELYSGADRSDSVIFSDDYDNLATTTYSRDETNMGNVALVAGEGQGSDRAKVDAGRAEGLNRFEIYVDAKDISRSIEYSELARTYPGGAFVAVEGGYDYVVPSVDIQIIDEDQLTELQTKYPGGVIVTVDGVQYYRVQNVAIAFGEKEAPEDNETVVLYDIIYDVYLLIRGYENLAEYGAVTSFEGTIIPDYTFVYKQDYFLGDIVTIQNEYGITVQARITEIVEVNDDNGYSIEPKFEYISQEG